MNLKTDNKVLDTYTPLTNRKLFVQSDLIEKTKEKADKGSKRFRNIQLTIFLSGLSVFAQLYLFQPLLPTVAKDFGISAGDSSLLVSSSTLGMALGLLFFAFKSDSFSRKNQMLFAMVSSAILTIVSAWIYSFPLLIAIGVVKGFVIAGVSSVALPYLTEEVKFSVIGLAISMYLNGNTIGGMSGRIVTTILDGEIGWRNTVTIIGMISLILAVIFGRYFPKSLFFEPQKTDFSLKYKEMKNFVSDPYMMRLYIVAFLIMGIFVSIYNYLTYRLESPPFH
ncbi:MFS transporter [Chryseobacterium sp. CH21]|uniref:MFS transporter n=1 Tax=Chryseobacterium sp. CH21 TaxID=713556 RepID=UPI001E29EB6C|nr:MFS transporter [Chryseobacterium sp. CH21]